MPLPKPYGEEGWLRVYRGLLPPGPFWDAYRMPGGDGEKVLRARAKAFAEYEKRLYLLLKELIPSGADLSLTSREAEAGLPSCCSGSLAASRSARLAELQMVWNDRGGIHADYYLELAKALGVEGATTEAFVAYTCETPCEEMVCDEAWHTAWRLKAPEVPVYDYACEGACEEPLRLWGDERMECEIRRKSPSGTFALVGYGE